MEETNNQSMKDSHVSNAGFETSMISTPEKSSNEYGIVEPGFVPKTAKDFEKEKKSRKKERIIGAIGDSIMALSNLFFTTKGAPSMYLDISTTGKTKNDSLKYGTLSEAIRNRHNDEDEKYRSQYDAWYKAEEKRKKEADDNAVYYLGNGVSVPKKLWENSDFIESAFFDLASDNGVDESLEKDLMQKFYGKDAPKGKLGTQLKRNVIEEIISGSDDVGAETRSSIIENFNSFTTKWKPIR